MVPPPPPLCTLPPGPGSPRFVCYCEPEGSAAGDRGVFRLHVTDGLELWSARLPPEGEATRVRAGPGRAGWGDPAGLGPGQPQEARCGLGADEDLTARFRSACQQRAVALSLREDSAALTLSGPPSTLTFDLSKVPGPEAAPRLQALTLGLAERVCSLEQRLAAVEETAASPSKSPQPAGPPLFLPDPDPQRGGPGAGVRRRSPGESLINPGFKSKKPAGGVDFDEP